MELLAERLVSDGTCVGVGSQTSGFLQSNKEKSAIAKGSEERSVCKKEL